MDDGIAAVAERIETLSAALIIDETGLIEELYYNVEQGHIARKIPPAANQNSISLTLTAVEDDLNEAVRGNYLSENTYVVRVLRRTIEIHAKNPERVEMDLVKVSKNLRGQIDKGDLPDAPELEGLHDTCVTGALDIRALHPNIAEARAQRGLQAIREASTEEKASIAESFETIRAISEVTLADDVIDDLKELTDGDAVPMSGDVELTTDAIIRSSSRTAKMWLIAKKVAAGTPGAAATIVVFDQAIPVLQKVWPILMKLLGF
ncbi:hypothetical protein L0664_15560 [Octadecabacter sp. G9-8]|uniref:AbiTii domain-containing protein n=1 Tax=Octadecabacter dasysiphoniae TaxID=2909341 RepID=A0ABS9CZK8_9RHOB|nr:hypothetical protein [Octadecabacter dasysiphoniae]MCF2872492.1 hypothetical protein [Octadecabacter dasysiphoniae]